MKVTTKEIVEALRGECNGYQRVVLADRIEAEGIDQDDGRTPIAWAVDTERFGRCYSVSDEFLKAFPNFPVPPSKADQMTNKVKLEDVISEFKDTTLALEIALKFPHLWALIDRIEAEGIEQDFPIPPPSIKDLVEEIKSVGVNNHFRMAIQALVDKYSLLK